MIDLSDERIAHIKSFFKFLDVHILPQKRDNNVIIIVDCIRYHKGKRNWLAVEFFSDADDQSIQWKASDLKAGFDRREGRDDSYFIVR